MRKPSIAGVVPGRLGRTRKLYDEMGNAHSVCGGSGGRSKNAAERERISKWLPEIDARQWQAIWQRVQAGHEQQFWSIANTPAGREELFVTVRARKYGEERLAEVETGPASNATKMLLFGRLQQEVLEAVASGVSLAQSMDMLCRRAERLAPGIVCSVIAVDPEGKLRCIAGPSIPAHFSEVVDGLPIGPSAGSCGSAAYLGRPVTVTDIANDPLWQSELRKIALPLGYKACWSSPIKSRTGRVIGTFAFYFSTNRGPTEAERRIVSACLHICAIAIERDEAQARIEEMAFHDTLTQLANRSGFQVRLADVLRKRPEGGEAVAVHCIDLEDFKAVNDTLGHPVGDKLLQAVATRLRFMTRRTEIIARVGSDEFAIIQPGITSEEDATSLAERVISGVSKPYNIDGQTIAIGASVGIAVGRYDAVTANLLMCNADLALYHAKNERRGSYRLFTPEIDERVRTQRTLENDLRSALAAGQIALNFQPLFDAEHCQILGFEALMRWHHPERGLVPAGDFVPAAERIGLIAPLGEWVMRKACETAARWPAPLRVAVNLSPAQFAGNGLVQTVSEALLRSGLPPQRLELEITESVLLQSSQAVRDTLHQLRSLGVRIALDDFGTGYSSLSYLLSFPFDKIKIDRSFIKDIVTSTRSQKIVKAVVAMASDLDMTTTAEGIESKEQLDAVRAGGCKEIQGYLLGRPMPAPEIDKLLASTFAPRSARRLRKRTEVARKNGRALAASATSH